MMLHGLENKINATVLYSRNLLWLYSVLQHALKGYQSRLQNKTEELRGGVMNIKGVYENQSLPDISWKSFRVLKRGRYQCEVEIIKNTCAIVYSCFISKAI